MKTPRFAALEETDAILAALAEQSLCSTGPAIDGLLDVRFRLDEDPLVGAVDRTITKLSGRALVERVELVQLLEDLRGELETAPA